MARPPSKPITEHLAYLLAQANREILLQAKEYARRLDETPVVIAVWDGQVGDGPGGTAEAIRLWEEEGIDVDVVQIVEL